MTAAPLERLVGLALALALVLLPVHEANAAKKPRFGFACKGCLFLDPPVGATAPPLVIVLHGDEGEPWVMYEVFAAPAEAAGVALLVPRCPRDLGCKGSYWQWSGDPAWLSGLADEVAKEVPIDPERVGVVGWSGGASYLGRVSGSIPSAISAVALAGGGIPPAPGPCGGATHPYFLLQGDLNPLHHLAVEARDALVACRHDVTWELLPGRGHAGEHAALTNGKAAVLIAWLGAHPRRSAAVAAPASAAASAPPPVPTVAAPMESTAPPLAPVHLAPPTDSVQPAPAQPATRGCAGCSVPSSTPRMGAPLLLIVGLSIRARRRGGTVPGSPVKRWARGAGPSLEWRSSASTRSGTP